jgi:hypothetical protein
MRCAAPCATCVAARRCGTPRCWWRGKCARWLRASLRGPATAPGAAPLDEVEFVLDGAPVGRSRAPFHLSVPLARGDHELVVRPANPALGMELVVSRFSVR